MKELIRIRINKTITSGDHKLAKGKTYSAFKLRNGIFEIDGLHWGLNEDEYKILK